jgi:two-component SAPR family response regulator
MLERMVSRLGHVPIVVEVPTSAQLTSADVLVVEPAAPMAVVLAQAVGVLNPTLPIVCASVVAPSPELAQLDIHFSAVLIKPFTSEQLNAAIDRSLCARCQGDCDRAA